MQPSATPTAVGHPSSSPLLLVLNDSEVGRAISYREAIQATSEAFIQLSQKQAQAPLRTNIPSENGGANLFMPARLAGAGAAPGGLGIKIVAVRPDNAQRGLTTVPAVLLLLDQATGLPVALLQATRLTAIRTAAGSALATDLLANKDARVMVVFGAGEQAQAHIDAICTVRRLKEVYIINRNKSRALDLQQHYQTAVGHGYSQIAWRVVDKNSEDENKAVSRADIIVTATNSSTPVFNGKYLKPGTHINSIGSYTPSMQEVDVTTVQRAKITVDQIQAALQEAGDLVIPLEKGLITASNIVELGQVVMKEVDVRQSDKDITFFKSVGNAAQDVSVAQAVFLAAQKHGLGQRVAFAAATCRL